MLYWFKAKAPIRRKFDVLFCLYTFLGASMMAATALLGAGVIGASTAVTIAALAFVTTVVLAFGSKKLICDPYVGTVVRMEGLAAGDLSTPIDFTDFTDCVGRMTKAMDVFRRNAESVNAAAEAQKVVVGALGNGLGRVAENDLTYRIDMAFPADYEKLRTDYNRAMDAVSRAMSAVAEASHGINGGAADIRQASDDLSQRTEQQAASLEETAAAMDEITTTVRETAAGAQRANSVVGEARGEAEQSGTIVQRAMDAMGGIERASSEISEIISVIDGIAFQTNLLALNAGVEAARAGDAGKGFAVVASEVRALAQRSADAAKDVKTKIMASSEQVQSGVQLVSETGRALQRIIGRISEISDLVGTITTSAEQQATGLQQVNTAVSEMDGVTQQNAAMVEQATAAARSLAEEADRLVAEVGKFRVGGQTGRAAPASPVHALQARAAQGSRTIARRVVAAGGGAAAARVVEEGDWSEF
uniref:methyl-accepting chemotaxis protein n=1 Tax=uncultured Sphingomonas sp. TaxID=158754 RepID=UPI00258DD10F|nr:methyl-accepting chemotaxis protein [uncultured Sphingomonas sp.]